MGSLICIAKSNTVGKTVEKGPKTADRQEKKACMSPSTKKMGQNAEQSNETESPVSSNPLPSADEKSSLPLGKRTVFGYSTNFHEKYIEGRLLGRGQFGSTYVATNLSSNLSVAVKKIDRTKMIHAISVEDVKREVKILAALTGHENVVQFYEAFEDDDFVYIVMELCEGGELLDRILSKKDARYTEKDAAIVVRQMLNVVARCHLHGIVHRDLKPENFLYKSQSEDSALKATDFGLSDFMVPDKKFRDIVGSAYYIAPEVLRRNSGPESDVWSIGVISFILLSGRRPFWDRTQDGIFKEVLKKRLDFNVAPWTSVSSSAKDFVKKLLVKDPKVRMTAAQALSHSWVREGGDAADIPLDISVLSNMRQFVKYNRLKQIALKAVGSTLDVKEIQHLHDQFNLIDIDKNGTITFEEIRQALNKDQTWKIKEIKVFEILQAMDSNRDGVVDFKEFVAATLHVYQLEEDIGKWHERVRMAFDSFDSDKDGFITADELKVYCGLKGSIGNLLDAADIDNDGRISLTEFRKLLQHAA